MENPERLDQGRINAMLLSIDPGNVKSAYVIVENYEIFDKGILLNEDLLDVIYDFRWRSNHDMAIEMIASYGMAVGQTVFETVFWIGRFWQYAISEEMCCTKVYRKDVKMYLCNSMRAKDANIRQAILDRYEPSGGGKVPQVGTKSNPGPLYGVSKDVWAALGVAITYQNDPQFKTT